MPAKVRVGHGTTITFETTGFDAEVRSMNFSGSSREPIDTTHLSSPAGTPGKMGGKTFLVSPIADPGEIAMEFHLDPDQVIPINEPVENIELEFPLQAGEVTACKWTFAGFIQDWDATVETEDVIQGTATVKISGEITVVPATTS